jgi:hypothetical protein
MKGKLHERCEKEEWKCSEKTYDESGHKRERKKAMTVEERSAQKENQYYNRSGQKVKTVEKYSA